MESYHETINRTSGNRALRPFEYIATPPIQHVLDAITGYCSVGGSFAPGIRQLGEMSGVALGAISQCLYELDRTGWISYDGHVIMLLRDQTDHAVHAPPADHAHDRAFVASGSGDQNSDRFDHDMVLTTTRILDSESPVVVDQIPRARENDHAVEAPPAAHVMAELGANPKIIREAFTARPDWTPAQVRDRWEYDQRRIAASDGRLNAGVFFTALRSGELAPVQPGALDPADYVGRDGFLLGGDASPPPETWADRAWRILPANASMADCIYVQTRLAQNRSDAEALADLAARRAKR